MPFFTNPPPPPPPPPPPAKKRFPFTSVAQPRNSQEQPNPSLLNTAIAPQAKSDTDKSTEEKEEGKNEVDDPSIYKTPIAFAGSEEELNPPPRVRGHGGQYSRVTPLLLQKARLRSPN